MNDRIRRKNTDKNSIPKNLGLYIHIPFCIKKCNYCDFLSGPYDEETKRRYFEALHEEIRSYEGRTGEYRVSTVFIGGGTPSSVDCSYIKSIMDDITEVFDIKLEESNRSIEENNKEPETEIPEITMEVNPGTVDREKLLAYKNTGINRLSFGLQSADANELKLLGRIHDYGQFLENYKLAREIGFSNINIDLMSALPGQTLSVWETTLEKTVKLNPEHISAYSLIIEEGTPFYDRYGEGKEQENALPDEDTDRRMYQRTKEILNEYGYRRYEISNYAKEGYECRHNLSYWIGTDYLGLGLGSSSLIKHTRFHNLTDMLQYIKLCTQYCKNDINAHIVQNEIPGSDILNDTIHIRMDTEKLSEKQRMEEFMFLGLRIMNGISKKDFYDRFNVEIGRIYGNVITRLAENKLLTIDKDRISLTDYGIDVSNIVLADFLLD